LSFPSQVPVGVCRCCTSASLGFNLQAPSRETRPLSAETDSGPRLMRMPSEQARCYPGFVMPLPMHLTSYRDNESYVGGEPPTFYQRVRFLCPTTPNHHLRLSRLSRAPQKNGYSYCGSRANAPSLRLGSQKAPLCKVFHRLFFSAAPPERGG
jgi:hypothetical protein